jgi:hypothetical protein
MKKKKKANAKMRMTTRKTPVLIKTTVGSGVYLVEAITKKGVFTTWVAEEDLL